MGVNRNTINRTSLEEIWLVGKEGLKISGPRHLGSTPLFSHLPLAHYCVHSIAFITPITLHLHFVASKFIMSEPFDVIAVITPKPGKADRVWTTSKL